MIDSSVLDLPVSVQFTDDVDRKRRLYNVELYKKSLGLKVIIESEARIKLQSPM